ncbi:MAG: FAD-dependent thymidylate synthase [Candidatus Micrarchaeaceae archaeon]|jgi:thymidylate synthase ThyX
MEETSNGFTDQFTDSEKEIMKPFFSNMEKDVFVLTNLPDVIKGTLFSRYSRSDKSARRLLLDEFITEKDVLEAIGTRAPASNVDSVLAIKKAEDFYQRILVGYGDDSVAELAGEHIACENVSSLAGDILTDSRIGISPLEKSARYVLFDKKVNGKYVWYREPKIMESKHESLYSNAMDNLFDNYVEWMPKVIEYIKEAEPKQDDATDRAYNSAIRAKACDILKNMLPASRLTNVGLFGNGRAFEYLLNKLYSSGLGEGQELATSIHTELTKTLPAFVKRAQPSEYLMGTKEAMYSFAKGNSLDAPGIPTEAYVRLVDYDKNGDDKVISRMLFSYTNMPIEKLEEVIKGMNLEKKKELVASYLSKRRNRRDKPGRSLENSFYTFEMCANYGIFRDLHRHRVMTLERQRLTTDLGFDMPFELADIGLDKQYGKLMESMVEVYKKIAEDMPVEAQYAVPRSYRMRWYMKLNMREVHHLTELRSTKQGHRDYRKVAQKMKTEIEKVHPLLTQYMQVDMNEYALPRLESEKRIDQKLAQLKEQESKKE